MNDIASIEQDFENELKALRSYYGGEELYITKMRDEKNILFTFYIIGSHTQINDLKNYEPGINFDGKKEVLILSDFAEWICNRKMKGLCTAESRKSKNSAKYFNNILKESDLLIPEDEIEFFTFVFQPQKVCMILDIPYNDCKDLIVKNYNELLKENSPV